MSNTSLAIDNPRVEPEVNIQNNKTDIQQKIESFQRQLDPECERAKLELNFLEKSPSQLQDIQEELCKIQPDSEECFFNDDITKLAEKFLEELDPLTECESILALSIVKIRELQLREALLKRHEKSLLLPPIATWSSPTLGAYTIPINGGSEYVVAFNRATFVSLLDLIKTFSSIIPIDNVGSNVRISVVQSDMEKLLESQPQLIVRVAILLANIVSGHGDQVNFETLALTKNQLLLSTRALSAVELFMLAHEYGHVYYQHSFPGTDETIDSKKYRSFSLAQEKEILADIYGHKLLLDFAFEEYQSFPIDALIIKDGGKIFLAIERLLKNARDTVGVEFSQENRYPSTEQRLQFLKEVDDNIPTLVPEFSQSNLGDGFVIAADVIWQRLRDNWPLFYQELQKLREENE